MAPWDPQGRGSLGGWGTLPGEGVPLVSVCGVPTLEVPWGTPGVLSSSGAEMGSGASGTDQGWGKGKNGGVGWAESPAQVLLGSTGLY